MTTEQIAAMIKAKRLILRITQPQLRFSAISSSPSADNNVPLSGIKADEQAELKPTNKRN